RSVKGSARRYRASMARKLNRSNGSSSSIGARLSSIAAGRMDKSAKVCNDLGMPAPLERRAAFYDVDGTLIRTNIVHAFAWYAKNQPTLTGSLKKTAKTALSIPLFLAADKLSRKLFNRLFYQYYAGEPRDRLVMLAEE